MQLPSRKQTTIIIIDTNSVNRCLFTLYMTNEFLHKKYLHRETVIVSHRPLVVDRRRGVCYI